MRRGLALLALAALVAGCTQTMRDYFAVKPMPPLALHQGMTDKQQCMHCHTADVAGAPPVPHPQYKRCTLCHETAASAH